jgi:radical SAM superfamily enzyme YgiQ (UPF0313 family)
MKLSKFLLVNPPYEAVGVNESVSSVSITLSLAMLAGLCRRHERDVRIVDLNLEANWEEAYGRALSEWQPDTVGITFATPTAPIAARIARWTKDAGDITVIGGGPHATALPLETLRSGPFDAVAVGEGETAFEHALQTKRFEETAGWATPRTVVPTTAALIDNLDSLPFAAVDLFDSERYVYPKRACRQNPVCLLETCRGCYARCTFCNKNIFGYKLRKKSADRVVDEMQFILDAGYREIHFADDLFTADTRHAEAVCRRILERGLRFPWVPRSGLRVDRVTPQLMEVMAAAGCYHIPFGIESGSQEILDRIQKGITLQQVRDAVRYAKEAGMETTGYFMVGIPGDTAETMRQTLEFASSLNLDYFKVGVCIPLPGTPMFAELEREGRIRTRCWEMYTYSTKPWDIVSSKEVTHETLGALTINGIPLLNATNRTMVRQGDGTYALG